MNLTDIAIKNRILVFSFLIISVFFGISVFNLMPRDDMPPFLIRYVTIVSSFPGAGPERMEMLVSDKIEKVIQE
ncbi:MAG: efflux RND transporter permease subunit, partial [Deltaproteobacteria bacterium]|nr:efflux RND transporter permease subunit [Deltaproteobacteria bacterium]